MGLKNGYFQMIIDSTGTYIKLFPAKDGGSLILYDEIKQFLENNQIFEYDKVNLGHEIEKVNSQEIDSIVKISPLKNYHINEYMKISVSDDKMTASVRFYPPSNGGNRVSADELKNDLNAAGIHFGVDENVILMQIANPVYCTDYVIAKGKPAVQGKNAFIKYMFDTNIKAKPKHNTDGSVDFHELENINHIKKDDVLAVLTPAFEGVDGINVYGEIIKPALVKHLQLKYGKNISISDDKLTIMSQVDGHVCLNGDKVFVSDTYEVAGDVDTATGDITYAGNVIVHGSVRTGFKIKASGNVEIFGAAEGVAIVSGGQVVLHHGIQGMTKGIIVAKGNVISKFIESARVQAGGYVEAESIIQSLISAKGDIIVNGGKGNIIGGHLKSGTLIEAKTVGSHMGIQTVLEVGIDPSVQDKLINLKKEIQEINNEYNKIIQIAEVMKKRFENGMLNTEKKLSYKKTLESMKEHRELMMDKQNEFDKLSEVIKENKNAMIKVSRAVNQGTRIIISGENHTVNEAVSNCQYYKVQGEIKVSTFT